VLALAGCLEQGADLTPPPGYRPAGVVALLHGDGADPALLFTRRHAALPDHAGQISFPGGALEAGEDFWPAACRECQEEIGIDPAQGNLLGRLAPVPIAVSAFFVVPFVVYLQTPPAEGQGWSRAEVVEVFSHSLAELAQRRRLERMELRGRGVGMWPVFDLAQGVLWGATAIMTDQLLNCWQTAARRPT
jgi:8-oxo-dGTP pyrophosphatase MutT (NUDIX family)